MHSLWSAFGSALALRSGEATDFFLPSLVIHGSMGVAEAALLVAGWPAMGLVTGLLTGEGSKWRRCPIRRRAFTRSSLVLLAPPVVVVAAALPLYLSDRAIALGAVDVFGPFLFALTVVLGWRVYRRAVATHRCASAPCIDAPH